MLFFDWLDIEQDFGYQLPLLSDFVMARVNVVTGSMSDVLSQPRIKHVGSFCDSITIRIRGSVLSVSGNPSRWNRLDNLWGFTSVDQCVSVYNDILHSIGLPSFTRCTRYSYRQTKEDKHPQLITDGAIIRELHITTNMAVGQGNVEDYLSGLSTLRYRNSVPRLHTDGNTVDWLSKKGHAELIYPSVYNKAYELSLHLLPKIKNKFSEDSDEFRYVKKVIDYCASAGIARFEQKLQNKYLQRKKLFLWGLTDYSVLNDLQNEFLNLDKKLMVTSMDFETISERLLSEGVVDTTRAANTTAMYAIQWSHGHVFDFDKRQVQQHRARLRHIGIDIAQRCNISKFSPVFVTAAREVVPVLAVMPEWYLRPNHLRAA